MHYSIWLCRSRALKIGLRNKCTVYSRQRGKLRVGEHGPELVSRHCKCWKTPSHYQVRADHARCNGISDVRYFEKPKSVTTACVTRLVSAQNHPRGWFPSWRS